MITSAISFCAAAIYVKSTFSNFRSTFLILFYNIILNIKHNNRHPLTNSPSNSNENILITIDSIVI